MSWVAVEVSFTVFIDREFTCVVDVAELCITFEDYPLLYGSLIKFKFLYALGRDVLSFDA